MSINPNESVQGISSHVQFNASNLTQSHNRDFWIGLTLAILSSFFIGSSFILKKKGLIKLSNSDYNEPTKKKLRAGKLIRLKRFCNLIEFYQFFYEFSPRWSWIFKRMALVEWFSH